MSLLQSVSLSVPYASFHVFASAADYTVYYMWNPIVRFGVRRTWIKETFLKLGKTKRQRNTYVRHSGCCSHTGLRFETLKGTEVKCESCRGSSSLLFLWGAWHRTWWTVVRRVTHYRIHFSVQRKRRHFAHVLHTSHCLNILLTLLYSRRQREPLPQDSGENGIKWICPLRQWC